MVERRRSRVGAGRLDARGHKSRIAPLCASPLRKIRGRLASTYRSPGLLVPQGLTALLAKGGRLEVKEVELDNEHTSLN